jgi:hypothetical protein
MLALVIMKAVLVTVSVLLGIGMVLAVLFVISIRRHYRELDRAEHMETSLHLVAR